MTTPESIRETVRKRYAAAATRSAAGDQEEARGVETSCCGGASVSTTEEQDRAVETSCCGGASVAAIDEQGRAGETSCCGRAPVATTDERGRVVFGADLYDAEVARVLRPGGRLAFSDVIADDDMDESTKADMVEWTGCIAGALTHAELTDALTAAGFTDLEIRPTHRVHVHAQAAIIRASLDRSEPHAPEQGAAPSVRDQTVMPVRGQTVSPARDQAVTPACDHTVTPVCDHTVSPAGGQTESPAGDQMERNPMTTTMTPTIEVFDPAMCCSTGVCGPSVDPELARFEADLRWLAARGASVTRYNLAQEPGEFVARPVVAAMLASGGEDALPIILVDGKVRFSGTWPSRTDLAAPSGIEVPAEHANLLAPAGSVCCTPTEQATTGCCAAVEQAGDACYTPTEQATTGCCAPAEQAGDACCTPTEQATTGCCAPAEQVGDACCTPTEKEDTGCCASSDQVGEPQVARSGSCC